MPTEPISPPSEVQPNVQSSIIPPAAPAPVRKTTYTIFIAIFIFVAILEAIVSYFLFIKKPAENSSAAAIVPTTSLSPSPTSILSQPLTSTPSSTPSLQVSPTPKNVTCAKDDQNCIFTNIINNFTGGCIPVEVTAAVDTGQQVTLAISSGANASCRFQMKGLGADQDCLFAKENVTTKVIKGMLGMDNIPKDPEFIKIKAASCK